MASYIPCNVEFLDYDGIEDEQERDNIRTSLHTINKNVELPWPVAIGPHPEKTYFQCGAVPLQDGQRLSQQSLHVEGPEETIPPEMYHHPQICSPTHQLQPNYIQHQFAHPPNASIYTPNQSFIVYSTVPLSLPFAINSISVTHSISNNNVNYVSNYSQSPSMVNAAAVPEIVPLCYPLQPISNEMMGHHSQPQQQSQIVQTEPIHDNDKPEKETEPIHDNDKPEKEECNGNDNSTITTITTNNENEEPKVRRSFASLFNRPKIDIVNNTNENKMVFNKAVTQETNNNNDEQFCPIKNPKKTFIDPICYRMGEYLLNHVLDSRTTSLLPRGLINRSNYCYINSILQALLACPPVYNLLNGLACENNILNEKQKQTPVIDGLCLFVKEFQHLPPQMRTNRRNEKNQQKKDQTVTINYDQAFEPVWIYKMLNGIRSDSFLVEGRQEDAEEFLGCLLNGLNDEMLELMKLVKHEENNDTINVTNFDKTSITTTTTIDNGLDKEWKVMGPKNKGSVTRKTEFDKTPISDIFGGFLKSRIHRTGDQSTDNIQPFFTLPLNIEKVKTVREALEALVTKNQLEGVTSSKTNEEVEAWQQTTLDELPIILVLHLKCFDFKLDGCTKIIKALEFPIDLKIDSKLLSSKPNTSKEKQYKLFAVVYHDGKEATKGHYVTDAFHVGYSSWIRYDDASVKSVQEENVLNPQGTRVPYLLFYRRSDTIRSK